MPIYPRHIGFGYRVKGMRLKLRQMEVFRAVMLTGSMNGAARLLCISQPAVSRLVSYTEQSLGLPLFERERGKLIPTPEADLLYQEIQPIYESMVRVDDFVQALATRPQGRLRLCCSPSLAIHYVPEVIASFTARHPHVQLQFHTTLLSEMTHELLSGKVDLAVSVLPMENPSLIVEPLLKGKMVCILPKCHVLAEKKVIALQEIAQHPMVLYSRTVPFGQLLSAAFEQAGVERRSKVDIERAEIACALVRRGVGLAIVDQFSVQDRDLQGLDVRPLDVNIPIYVSLIRSRYARPSQQVHAFTQALKNYQAPAA